MGWTGVEHWWNRVVYEYKSRDIWLWTDGQRWLVQWRLGPSPVRKQVFDLEPEARAHITLLKRAAPEWRQLSMPPQPLS